MTKGRSEGSSGPGMHVGRTARSARFLLPGVVLVATLGAAPLATAFLQVPDESSPKSGTAQVVAQAVASIADNDWVWRVSERTASPPANASAETSDLAFIVVDSGAILVENRDTAEQFRLPAGEAMISLPGSEHVRAALGADAAIYQELALVEPTAEPAQDAVVAFTSDAFPGPGASHDLDLLLDGLAPGAQMAVPGGALPTLVSIRSGAADIATESGDVFSLGGGESIALSGALGITATENGAEVAVVYTGPAVPRLAQVAATPAAQVRQIEAAAEVPDATAVASPAAEPTAEPTPAAEAETEAAVDTDGDGLVDPQESELNTDPGLVDTDGDGLSDGQEALESGTSPLIPDTDGDGVLDGDEVAQGTDPLDGVVTAPEEDAAAVEAAATVEEAAGVEEAPVATAGDGDGDGLEDAIEAELGTDPFDLDTDDDGLTDGDEYYVYQTGTRNPDSDGDGVLDGDEAANGTDPNDINSF